METWILSKNDSGFCALTRYKCIDIVESYARGGGGGGFIKLG